MWSFSSSSQYETTALPPLHDRHRFFTIRSFVEATKKLFGKIRDARPFRRPISIYVSYDPWRSMYMNNELSNMASSSEDGKDSTVLYDYEFVGIRRSPKPRHLLEMDETVESSNSDWMDQESENVLEQRSSEDNELECAENKILGQSNGVSKSEEATNPMIARDLAVIPVLHETQSASEHNSVSSGTSSSSEKYHEVSESADDGDVHELGRDHVVTNDLPMIRLKSKADQCVGVNEIGSNPDFQKDRSPGSTIETKWKGKTANCKDRTSGKDTSRESPVWEWVEEEHVFTTSKGSSSIDSSKQGLPWRWKRNQRRRRPPLSKISFRGMLYRTYQKVDRLMT